MELETLYEAANSTFLYHPEKEHWFALPEEVRKGSLAVAQLDVETRLGFYESADPRFLRAILEQAVFLACSPDEPGKRLVHESIDGIGSRTWEFDKNAETEFAPRALRLIEAMEKEQFSTTLTRG